MLPNRLEYESQSYVTLDKALFFDGVNDYIQVPDWRFGTLNNTHPWSFSFWIKPDATQVVNTRIFSDIQSSKGVELLLQNTLRLDVSFQTGATTTYQTGTLTADVWTYVSAVFTPTTLKVYFNSVEVFSTTHTLASFAKATADRQFRIGANNTALNSFFKGYLGYFRKYSKELNQQEMTYEHRFIGHILDSAAKRCIYELPNQEDIRVDTIIVQTDWNIDIDGPFNPSVVGGATTWGFGTDEVTGTSPNYSGAFLSGVGTKTVIVTNTDFSAVTSVNFIADKIVAGLDLSIITGGNKAFSLQDNPSLLSVRTGACNLTTFTTSCNVPSLLEAVYLSDSTCSGTLNITNVANNLATLELPTGTCTAFAIANNKLTSINTTGLLLTGTVTITNSTLLTSLIFDPALQTVTAINARGIANVPSFNASQLTVNGGLGVDNGFLDITISGGNLTNIFSVFGNLNTLNLGSAVIGDSTLFVFLQSNNMTIAEIDAVLVELDRVALVLSVPGSCTITLTGNAAPTGGAANLNVDSLRNTKNYTVDITP